MVSKKTPVNDESVDLGTFCGRLVAERKRLGMTQTDLRTKTAVSKSAQMRYESGETSPDVVYLDLLDGLGFDLMYLLKGVRSGDALEPELQNLVEAYTDAVPELRRAAFGVLISPYIRSVERARVEPGWFRHELRGEGDARFAHYHQDHPGPRVIQDTAPKLPRVPGQVFPPAQEETKPKTAKGGSEDD